MFDCIELEPGRRDWRVLPCDDVTKSQTFGFSCKAVRTLVPFPPSVD